MGSQLRTEGWRARRQWRSWNLWTVHWTGVQNWIPEIGSICTYLNACRQVHSILFFDYSHPFERSTAHAFHLRDRLHMLSNPDVSELFVHSQFWASHFLLDIPPFFDISVWFVQAMFQRKSFGWRNWKRWKWLISPQTNWRVRISGSMNQNPS